MDETTREATRFSARRFRSEYVIGEHDPGPGGGPAFQVTTAGALIGLDLEDEDSLGERKALHVWLRPHNALKLSRWLRQAAADVEAEGPTGPDDGEPEDQP